MCDTATAAESYDIKDFGSNKEIMKSKPSGPPPVGRSIDLLLSNDWKHSSAHSNKRYVCFESVFDTTSLVFFHLLFIQFSQRSARLQRRANVARLNTIMRNRPFTSVFK